MQTNLSGIVTGQVLPAEGAEGVVPSTITSDAPTEWTGIITRGVLYSGNMACDRDSLLAEGAFDERRSLRFAAEDNDLCHRWAKARRPLRYEPQLIVTHHDWRSEAEMAAVYARYARGQGAFYAKHLLRGDRDILRFVLSDLWRGTRPSMARILRRETAARASAYVLPAMLVGLADGAWDALSRGVRRRFRKGESS
jgi:GT2 family glycosyltransferase